MNSWHDDNQFWEVAGEVMFSEDRWASAVQDVDNLLALLGAESPATVLDMCCGPGRHALELAQRGFQVTGVDRTAYYLENARAKANNHGLQVDFILEDMRTFKRPQEFDFAINLYTSFGYFEDQADNQRVLENLYHSLRPGGVLAMEMMGKEVLARIFLERTWDEVGEILFLQEHRVINNWSQMENRWILLKGDQRYEYTLTHWLYSAHELKSMLTRAGFSDLAIYGDLAGNPYNQTARRMVAVAHRN
ncbi:MAG TPA: methyltransferase domain-containing protein [Anaerolineales bacterium]|nr:methyltransferase domain-containing protein [Anaerolineales bacterium]